MKGCARMTDEEAIKILDLIHLGRSFQVKEACKKGIISFGKWHKCSEENPDKNGYYLIANGIDNMYSFISSYEYVVGCGWNCHICPDGEVFSNARIFFENREETYWAEIIVDRSEENG